MKNLIYLCLLVAVSLTACQNEASTAAADKETTNTEGNPPAEGFNAAASDEKAIAIADEVMEAMGGRENWDASRYFYWNFFGSRTLLWDKKEGKVKITILQDSTQIRVDLNTGEGVVSRNDSLITEEGPKQQALTQAKSIWINDAYWVFMPFKLKDSGVTLKYLGTDTTQAGQAADLLQLTFENVGDTPQNKYHIWVSQEERLVRQWAYFNEATEEEPRFTLPWDDYTQHGKLLLSGNRGERQITGIKVMDEVPPEAFALSGE
jgi:plasmid maintenance system killer protein